MNAFESTMFSTRCNQFLSTTFRWIPPLFTTSDKAKTQKRFVACNFPSLIHENQLEKLSGQRWIRNMTSEWVKSSKTPLKCVFKKRKTDLQQRFVSLIFNKNQTLPENDGCRGENKIQISDKKAVWRLRRFTWNIKVTQFSVYSTSDIQQISKTKAAISVMKRSLQT